MLKNNKASFLKREKNNFQWKGNNVGYNQLHEWVKRRLPKPKLCQECNKIEPIDLANKGVYNRELKNWEWLCRRCHMLKDGRLKKFLNYRTSFKKGNTCYKLARRLKGEESSASKLKEKDVLLIRSDYSTGKYTQEELAKKYLTCFQNISFIVRRKSWKHI